jgi:homoserine O-succinyltransferase
MQRLDGIIVTGAEPKASHLKEEPYWASIVQVMDWATENTTSAVYSCLAVHGAVMHIDGVERHKLAAKCIGVFPQRKVSDHPLMHDVPATFRTPHARWNEVKGRSLADCGYSVLTQSVEAGIDCFVKQQKKSLFVHFQGHPEYDTRSLLGEFRRDIGRFLRGESEVCPTIPERYFDVAAEATLVDYRRKAVSNRCPELFSCFPADELTKGLRNVWQSSARRVYRNWLLYMATRRAERSTPLSVKKDFARRPGWATA